MNQAVIELVRNPAGHIRRLYWDGGEPIWLPPDFTTAQIDSHGINFPSMMPNFDFTVRELITSIARLLAESGMVQAEDTARLLALIVFATWIPDRLSAFFSVVLVSPSQQRREHALRVLHQLVRRSLALTFQSVSALQRVPYTLRPSLLIEAARPTKPLQRWLESNTPELPSLIAGQAVDTSGCRIIATSERPVELADAILPIDLAQETALSIDEAALREQTAALMGYRMKTCSAFAKPIPLGSASELSLPMRVLRSCCWDDPKVASEFRSSAETSSGGQSGPWRWACSLSAILIYKILKYHMPRTILPDSKDPAVLFGADMDLKLAFHTKQKDGTSSSPTADDTRSMLAGIKQYLADTAASTSDLNRSVRAGIEKYIAAREAELQGKGGTQQ